MTLKVDNRLPNLVNLNEDPQLSEVLLYVVREGVTRVGRKGSSSRHEIQLHGALMADNHWYASVYSRLCCNSMTLCMLCNNYIYIQFFLYNLRKTIVSIQNLLIYYMNVK